MTLGLIGKKCGMTRIFTDTGAAIPVTVLEVSPNRITQIKTVDSDGYSAIQVTAGERKQSKLTKAEAGHFAKAGVAPGTVLREFKLDKPEDLGEMKVGEELTVERFEAGQYVDVQGTSKGKGYAGVVKRHNFRTQDNTHGNSLAHRAPGSIGNRQSPGRVFPGKLMSGHMGDVTCTVLSQEVARVDAERGLIFVKGQVPGAENGTVIIRPAVKVHDKKSA